MSTRSGRWWILPALAILAASAVAAQQAKKVDEKAIKNAGKTGEEWLTYGLNYQETRYSPLKQIDAGNVKNLGLAWTYDVGNGGGGQEDTPLYHNGVLYGVTNWSVSFAVDARTGKEKWRWDPRVNRDLVNRRICCGNVNRGLGIYNGKIYVPVIDGRLAALDAETGKVLWTVQTTPPEQNYTITMAPRIVKNKVIIGASGAEYPVRGFFSAYDTETGKMAWRFYTVPGDPKKPYENPALKAAADTWSGEFWKLGGGGTVWDGMAYDPDLNLFYTGTGNGGPWPEELRQSKGKDNLYVASILAVNPDNGQLKWHYQEVPGDSWDFDAVGQLTLADIMINGKERKVIMQAAKNGFFYVLDRTNGEFISAQPFALVNWASGYDAKGKPIFNPDVHYGSNRISVMPGPGGAHNWSPMSFNPNSGLIYIPTTPSSSFTYTIVPNFTPYGPCMNAGVPGFVCPEAQAAQAAAGRGGAVGAGSTAAPPPGPPGGGGGRGGRGAPIPPAGPTIGPALNPPGSTAGARGGFLMAWDPATNKEVWRGNGGGGGGGGTLTTAGNLVFQVIQNGGRLVAYSADKGEMLLDLPTGPMGNMGPPITYMLDGKQYIALLGGGGGGQRGAPGGGSATLPDWKIPGNVPVNVPVAGGAPGPGGYAASPTTPPASVNGAPPNIPRMYTFVLNGKPVQ
ncbi:MAG TPA: PQQ-dependent dehydrogenase, methanol/ethanol family [Terriglobia bacterium]